MLKYWFKKYCGRKYPVEVDRVRTSYFSTNDGTALYIEGRSNAFGTWDVATRVKGLNCGVQKDAAEVTGLSFTDLTDLLKSYEEQILERHGGRTDFDNYLAERGKDAPRTHICNVLWRIEKQSARQAELKYLKSGKRSPGN